MRAAAILCVALALFACAPQPPPLRTRPEIIPGEVVVHTAGSPLLTTASLATATGRDDFAVRQVSCFMNTCRVMVERIGAAADEEWTYALVAALASARVPGIGSVEPSLARSR